MIVCDSDPSPDHGVQCDQCPSPGDVSPGASGAHAIHPGPDQHLLRHLGNIALKDSDAVTLLVKTVPACSAADVIWSHAVQAGPGPGRPQSTLSFTPRTGKLPDLEDNF